MPPSTRDAAATDAAPTAAPAAPSARETATARRSALRRAAPLIALLCGAGIGAWALGDTLSLETLRENRAALETWREANGALAAGVYLAAYVALVAFSLPGALAMTLTGGFLFGLAQGGLLTLIGATLGAVGIFLAARSGLGERLSARMDASAGMIGRLKRGLAANQVSVLLLMRLAPVVPFFIANLLPAFMGVRLRTYAWTTFFGIMPGTLVYTSVGAGLGEVFDRGETPNLGLLFEPHVLGPLLGLSLLAALPAILRAWRGAPLPVDPAPTPEADA